MNRKDGSHMGSSRVVESYNSLTGSQEISQRYMYCVLRRRSLCVLLINWLCYEPRDGLYESILSLRYQIPQSREWQSDSLEHFQP